MKTVILTIGNEVTSGLTINSNAARIGQMIEVAGLTPDRVITLRDDVKELVSEIRRLRKKYQVIIITGGLGPTPDDVTKPALVKVFNAPLALHKPTLAIVRGHFRRLDKPMPEINIGQAMVPAGFTALPNRKGTAPGLYYHDAKTHLFALPGVPREMEELMKKSVAPILKKIHPGAPIVRRLVKTAGIGETHLLPLIEEGGLMALKGLEIAFLPGIEGVNIRLTATTADAKESRRMIARAEKIIKKSAGRHVYGKDEDKLPGVIGDLLRKEGYTLAAAESCTGGLFSSLITSVAGSSDYFLEGAVTYTNEAKMKRLGVKKKTLIAHGAVSSEVAAQMAAGVARTSGATIGLSATGVAGPGGGTKEKPVGLVWLGLSFGGKVETRKVFFRFDRITNQRLTAWAMLFWLLKKLREKGMPKSGE